MNLICPKCGEILVDAKEHADAEACMASMRELLARVRKVFSVASFNVARCRARKHGGAKILGALNLCMHCLGAGFSGYQVGHEVMTTGKVPEAREVKS